MTKKPNNGNRKDITPEEAYWLMCGVVYLLYVIMVTPFQGGW